MTDHVDSAVEAFVSSDSSIATFDRRSLVEEDQSTIPIMEIVRRFGRYDVLTGPGNKIILPLHRKSTAELSGEYVEFRRDRLRNSFVYFDSNDKKLRRTSVDAVNKTSIASRLRLWTSDHEPDPTLSYLRSDSESLLSSSPISEADSDNENELFGELRSFVRKQMEAERDEVRRRYYDQRLGRVVSGIGGAPELAYIGRRDVEQYSDVLIFGVVTDSKSQESSVDITRDHGIYPHAEAILGLNDESSHATEAGTSFPIEGTVAFTRGQHVGLSVDESSEIDSAQLESILNNPVNLFCIVPLLNRVPYERELTGIDAIQRHRRKRDILCGRHTLEFQPSFAIEFDWDGIQLNEFQQQAAERSLRARDIFCIHGPPGTGKTRTLNTIIKTAVADGLRVLACAHSNQAVDNLLAGNSTPDSPDLDSLHASAIEDEFRISRVGSNSNHPIVRDRYVWADDSSADVVCATTNSADKFSVDEFDLAVVDEATQASIPATLVPYAAAERLILAGDHKQLPPYGSNEFEEGEIHISLFEHLLERYDENLATLLQRQYRMNEQIAGFPNIAFYDRKLETDDRNRSWTIDDFEPVTIFDIVGREGRTRSKSYENKPEAELAAEEAQKLLENGVDASDIGIITPYTGQISTIHQALSQIELDSNSIKVDTIDSFQGGEREAIILSFVRSNKQNNAGFLTFPDEGARRLNVALTRARKRLVIIGDFETLGSYSGNRDSNNSSADLYSALSEYFSE